ncbi:hypothetical protein LguiA_018477 [Lonicera macranthoides]
MEKSEMINSNKEVVDEHEFQEILKSLTKEVNFHSNYILYHYKGFWCPSQVIKAMLSFRKHFQPKNNDIIVASAFKSGTTWLKALTFSIINRAKYSLIGTKESPLLTKNPHSLVYNLEYEIYYQDELVTWRTLLDLKDDINLNVKKIAEFLEFPFTEEEENKGLVEEISELCEFENLKNLQINKVGIQTAWLANRDFFRKGQVGDWVNYLSLPQAERLEKIAKEKLSGYEAMSNTMKSSVRSYVYPMRLPISPSTQVPNMS